MSIIFKQAHEPLPPPREFRPDLPESVEQILLKALAKDREDRFQNAAEFKAALLQVQQSLAGDKDVNLAPPGKSSQRDVRSLASPDVEKETAKAKPWRLVALTGGGLLLVIILAGLFLSFRGPTAQENPGPAVESEVTTPLAEASRPEPVVSGGVSPVGTLRFADNETVRAGSFSLHMDGVDTPPSGSHYELWLTDSNREKTLNLVSQLVVNNGRVNFEGSTEQNLLGNYSQVIVSLEPDDDSEAGMSDQVVFAGSLPGESLAHLRQVTFKDPVNGKGFLPGAEEQILIAISHTGFVQEALAGDDLSQARRHAEHVVNILEGKEGPHFGDLDGDGLAQNPGDGFGVRPYLARALEQIQLASETTTVTADTQLYADRILTTGNNNLALIDAAAEKALQIFAADTVAEAQSFADELEMLVDQVLNGADLDNNGAIDPTKNEGGIEALYQDSLRMGEMPIFATE